MKQFYTSLKSVIALLALNLIILFTNPVLGQYVLQSADVIIDNLGFITGCNITDFNVTAYQNGNIEIPAQIDGKTIAGIDGRPPFMGGGSFENKGITALILPASLNQISIRAFANNAITTLTIPEGVTMISNYAFADNSITSVSLPSTLKEIYNYAFSGNTNLTNITLPINSKPGFAGWEDSNGQLYAGGDAITDFTLTYLAQFIETYTLTDADVTITNGKIIACSNSIVGASIVIPDTLQGQEVTGIDANVFSALNIEDITLPTPETLGFTGWLSGIGASLTGGATVTDLTTSYTAQFITTYTLADADVTISNGTILACSNVDGANIIIIPDTLQNQEVTGIDANVFSVYGSITEIILPTPENPYFVSWLSGEGTSYKGGSTITDFTTPYGILINEDWYTLTDDDAKVDKGGRLDAVSYDFSAKNIIIPDTLDGYAVKEIIYGNFEEVGLIKLKLPSTLEIIGNYAFIHNQIESIEISDSTYIEMGVACFNGNKIAEINGKPSNGLIYARNSDGTNDSTTIVSYGGGKTVVDFIPSNATTIGYFAFAECGITELVIPNTITQIDAAAFNLNKISKLNGAVTDGIIFARKPDGSDDSTKVVSYCGTATVMNFIPSTVTKIGKEAFSSSELTSVTIPANINTIEYGGFYANNIKSVIFTDGGNLKYIGSLAFHYNTGLKLTLPTSNYTGFVGWMDNYRTFYSAGASVITNAMYTAYIPYTLTDADVVVQEGNIVSYTNTDGYTAITIPDTLDGQAVIGIRAGVFKNKGIVVTYLPTHANLPDFNGWLNFKNNTIAKSTSGYPIFDFDVTYIANMPSYTLTSMDVAMNGTTLQSCSYPFVITDIVIPDTLDGYAVKILGAQSFYGKGITSIQLPSTLETIGTYSLTRNLFSDITIPANVTTIGTFAFYGSWTDIAPYLKNIIFETGSRLKKIGDYAFYGNTYLTKINLPNSIQTIGKEAFYLCYLQSIYIPKSIKTIGENAFCNQGVGKQELTSVVFENNSNLEYIGPGAFANNVNIPGFTLPTSAFPAFRYWRCGGVGVMSGDKTNYAEGETTTVLTAHYLAEYTYTLTDADVTVKDNYITGYNNDNFLTEYIIIPDTLDGQVIKGIEERGQLSVFYSRGLRGIVLPKSLEYIPINAFMHNPLSYMDMPDSLVYVGESAFHSTGIDSIVLPNHTTTGFVGWLRSDGDWVGKENGEYVTRDFFGISYSSAYEVLFYSFDGKLIKTDIVKHYQSAEPPEIPERTGYTFTGWDTDYSYITHGLSVTAQYSVSTYNITFNDWDGTQLSQQTIEYGKAATAPSLPARSGYTFAGWDVSYSKVTSDLTITAQYNKDGATNYMVLFKDWNGSILSKQTVVEGDSASTPFNPERSGYTFTGWDNTYSSITSDMVINAQYSINSYPVTFKDYNGIELKTESVEYLKAATAPSEPSRTGYTFAGWDTDFSMVEDTLTVTATYNINAYTVTFKDWDGTVLKTELVDSLGSATTPNNPVRLGYHFTGWDASFETITEDLVVNALYIKSADANTAIGDYIEGGVVFYIYQNGDDGYVSGEVNGLVCAIEDLDSWRIGWCPDYANNSNPLSASIGTSSDLGSGKANTERIVDYFGTPKTSEYAYNYSAYVCHTAKINTYTDWFLPSRNELSKMYAQKNTINTVALANGGSSFQEQNTSGTNQYYYSSSERSYAHAYVLSFYNGSVDYDSKSFTNLIRPVREFSYSINNTYTVTFKDWDNTVLRTQVVGEGGKATAPETAGRTGYTFKGWDVNFNNVTSDLTVTAQYSINTYTVIFKDYDDGIFKTETVNYGSSATAPSDPTRNGYAFTGWDAGFSNIVSDLIIVATYDINTYKVKFKDYDGTVLDTQIVEYGKAAIAPSTSARVGYVFIGWDINFNSVSSDLTVTAQYIKSGATHYSVIFKDWDGTVLSYQTIVEGGSALVPIEPTRTGYTFAGWDMGFSNVDSDLTVTALYNITSYAVTFKDYDGAVIKTDTVDYGNAAIAPLEPVRTGYTFAGWDMDFSNVDSPLTVTALYNIVSYTVTFKDYDGTILKIESVEYEKSATAPVEPSRTGYTFISWDLDFSKIVGELTITAQYSINRYIVIFKDYDGAVLKTDTVDYGNAAAAPSEPTRTGYTFAGWGIDFSNVTGNLTVTATYTINTSSNNHEGNINIRVYPNPVSDKLYIDMGDIDNRANSEIIIYDILGNKIYQQMCNEKIQLINVSFMESGIYFVKIANNVISIIKK